jgi:hypothetical protein
LFLSLWQAPKWNLSRFAGVSDAQAEREPAGEILSERSESKDLKRVPAGVTPCPEWFDLSRLAGVSDPAQRVSGSLQAKS